MLLLWFIKNTDKKTRIIPYNPKLSIRKILWNRAAGGYLSKCSSRSLRLLHFSLHLQRALQSPPAASGLVPTVCWVLFVGHACSLAGWVHVRILSRSMAGLGTTRGVCLHHLRLVSGCKSTVVPQCTVLESFWVSIMNGLLDQHMENF